LGNFQMFLSRERTLYDINLGMPIMHSLSFDFTVAEETLMFFVHRNFLRNEFNINKK